MANIYGRLGATKILIQKLGEVGIHSLHNLGDVEKHLKESDSILKMKQEKEKKNVLEETEVLKEQYFTLLRTRTQQWNERRDLLTQELEMLVEKLSKPLEETKNPIRWLFNRYRNWKDLRRRRILEDNFDDEVNRPLLNLTMRSIKIRKEREYLEDNIDSVVSNRLASYISEKKRIDQALNSLRTWISGARGERKVLNALAKLPDSFTVINDINLRLMPPLKSEEGPRFYCQADHVVIGPPGIFNIETKNWSPNSIKSLNMRSPVNQIKLTGKAIYREVNRAIRERQIRVKNHHWGDRSVRVRNILAMVGAMPHTEFQYIKMLQVNRLCGYIEYFEQMLNDVEVKAISNWFLYASQN